MRDVNYLIEKGVKLQQSLELFGDIAVYNQNLEIFLDEILTKLEQLQKTKEIGDMQHYAIYVHSLKSSAKYFGFEKLALIAANHEKKASENNLFYICEEFDNLTLEIKNMILIASTYLKKEIKITTHVVNKEQKVLVVDDSIVIRNYVKKLIKDYDVLLATDGEEALQVVESDIKLAGILLDLNMPNIDGFAVLDYFKAKNLFLTIPIAVITGEDNEDVIKKACEYPIVAVLRKPFNELTIKEAVSKLLRNSI